MSDFFPIVLNTIAYISFILFVVVPFYVQSRIYYPKKQHSFINTDCEDIYITTGDGLKINAWYSQPEDTDITVVFCHGNGGNLPCYEEIFSRLQQHGYGVLAIDYRGYGNSEGKPNEKGLYEDLRSAVKYLNNEKATPNSNIVLWGLSLGGAVVSKIAAENSGFRGVILQNTFTNLTDVLGNVINDSFLRSSRDISIMIAKFIPMLQKFDTKSRIHLIKSPMLLAHSISDDIIPVDMCAELFKLNSKAELFITKKGGHNVYGWFYPRLFNFLESLEDSRLAVTAE